MKIRQSIEKGISKKEIKEQAQLELMHMVANTLTTYREQGDNDVLVCEEIEKQADRIARLFGFEKAWHN